MIIILEGSDCAGKTTLMQALVKEYESRPGNPSVGTTHFGNYPYVTDYPRLYAEAMMPALSFSGVVSIMDRSWISETPYAIAYRNGIDRFTMVHRRMLERMSLSAYKAVVVLCDPGFDSVKERFLERVDDEYLDDENQLKIVYEWYKDFTESSTCLPVIRYDYKHDSVEDLYLAIGEIHPNTMSYSKVNDQFSPAFIGNSRASVIIVGSQPDVLYPEDLHTTLPFVSFNKNSVAYKLSNRLDERHVDEKNLAWIFPKNLNAETVRVLYGNTVILIGDEAVKAYAADTEDYMKHQHSNAESARMTKVVRVNVVSHASAAQIAYIADTIAEEVDGVLNV